MKKQIKEMIIYQGKNGGIEFKGDIKNETIWATQAQIAELFQTERSVITKHINKIIDDTEVDEKSNVQKMHIANSDRPVTFYSLDVVLSVGYRTNSKVAIEFRKWATKILKGYSLKGFAINKKIVQKNYQLFLSAIEDVKKVLPEHFDSFNSENAIDLVKLFASTWLSLDAYDKGQLENKKVTKELVKLETKELQDSINEFKNVLMESGEATDFFATDRHKESLQGIVGNVMQSFGGQSVYKSVEEKAAHLLYFIIKNHPFIDGNKRTGAYSFVWYLNRNKRLNTLQVTPSTLTALTVLVAESNPEHKENLIKLIMKLVEK